MSGPRVVVTRPLAQATELCEALRAHGAVALAVPLLVIEPSAAAPVVDGRFVVVVYVSRNAVAHGHASASSAQVVVALGPATAAALNARGAHVDVVANPAGGSEALLEHEALSDRALRGKRVLIVKGQGGRTVLRETFVTRGAEVTERDVYQRRPAPGAADALARCFDEGSVQAVVLTSVEIAAAWLDSVPPAALGDVLSDTLHVVISERIEATLRAAGVRRTAVASSTYPAVLAVAAVVGAGPA